MLEYRYKAYEPGVKEKSSIWQLMVAASGIQAGFWESIKNSNKHIKKKEKGLVQVNPNIQKMDLGTGTVIHVGLACQEAEIDEQWSYVFGKK